MSPLLALLFLPLTTAAYVNGYDDAFTFTCPDDEFINVYRSDNSDWYQDRRFDFECRSYSNVDLSGCEWSGYQNDFDEVLLYSCPDNGIVTGVSSFHDSWHQDRKFSIRCCQMDQYETTDCYYTDFLNNWDQELHYELPDNAVMRGMFSYHSDWQSDRRWKVQVCLLKTECWTYEELMEMQDRK